MSDWPFPRHKITAPRLSGHGGLRCVPLTVQRAHAPRPWVLTEILGGEHDMETTTTQSQGVTDCRSDVPPSLEARSLHLLQISCGLMSLAPLDSPAPCPHCPHFLSLPHVRTSSWPQDLCTCSSFLPGTLFFASYSTFRFQSKYPVLASLAVQWLGTCLPMKVVWVQALVRKLRSQGPQGPKNKT